MSEAYSAYRDGVIAGVHGHPRVIPDKYWDDPYMAETWSDGYEEGCIRDIYYCKQYELELEYDDDE